MTKVAATNDRGSASIWIITVVMVIATATAVACVLGGAIVGKHRAASAADLAALAGATTATTAMQSGAAAGEVTTRACAAARDTAVANGAAVVGCVVSGSSVWVTAAVALTGLPRLVSPAATARARAGPS